MFSEMHLNLMYCILHAFSTVLNVHITVYHGTLRARVYSRNTIKSMTQRKRLLTLFCI